MKAQKDNNLPKIEKLKKGEVFKMPKGKTVYVRGDYNRSIGKYECHKWDDISAFKNLKKGTEVITEFDF